MKSLIMCAVLALAACATPAPIREIDTKEVVVTRFEKSVREDQLPTPPAAMGARPVGVAAALDLAIAKLCEYVGYAAKADPLLRSAAGLAPTGRVREPVCDR